MCKISILVIYVILVTPRNTGATNMCTINDKKKYIIMSTVGFFPVVPIKLGKVIKYDVNHLLRDVKH